MFHRSSNNLSLFFHKFSMEIDISRKINLGGYSYLNNMSKGIKINMLTI